MIERYERAKALWSGDLTSAIPNTTLFPVWIEESHSFWYEKQLTGGKEFRLVDAEKATNELAFNHHSLAKALSRVSNQGLCADNLPILSQ